MRGVHRWLAVSSVVAIAVMVCAFTAHHALAPRTFVLQLSDDTLPADGFSSKELKVRSSSGRDLRDLQVKVQNPRAASVEWVAIEQDSATAGLRAGVLPGVTKLRVSAPVLSLRKSRSIQHSTPPTHSVTAHPTFCVFTIRPTVRHFAGGSP